jgi:aminoglycoside phosphotransferase (APT) family kinase protein
MPEHANPGATLVAPVHAFDESALAAFMRAQVSGFSGPVLVEQFQGGQSNPTYRVTAGDRSYVLRRKPPGKLLPSAHAVDREYRVMAALAGSGVPSPMVALCEDPSDRHVLPDNYIDGRVLWDPTLRVDPEARRATRVDRVQATLHQVDYQAWDSATSASRASTSSVRSRAGRSSTPPAAPHAFTQWTH